MFLPFVSLWSRSTTGKSERPAGFEVRTVLRRNEEISGAVVPKPCSKLDRAAEKPRTSSQRSPQQLARRAPFTRACRASIALRARFEEFYFRRVTLFSCYDPVAWAPTPPHKRASPRDPGAGMTGSAHVRQQAENTQPCKVNPKKKKPRNSEKMLGLGTPAALTTRA